MVRVHELSSAAIDVSLGRVCDDLAVLTDKLVRGPLVGGSVKDTSTVELEELEALLLSLGAVALALGKVVQDGAVVRLGPGVPGEGEVAASVDLDRGLAGSSLL